MAAFAADEHVLVLPGGDIEAARPFRHRNRIVFAGRTGYARLAMEAGVPIVPIVTAGTGESLLVLHDGQPLARWLRADRLLRTKALPISVSIPWGLNAGVVGLVPYLPLPTKLRTAVLASIRHHPDESADRYARRIEAAMQRAMDDLTAGRRLIVG
jgi:1-acyl-sn-glycerol-3-phosphate acyltransferase